MFSGAHKLEAQGAGTKMWGAQTWGARTWGRSNRIPHVRHNKFIMQQNL